MTTNAWVAKAKDGFNTLDVSEKYINPALKWLEVWLTDEAFADYVPQIQYLIDNGNWNFLAWSVSVPTGLIPGPSRHPPRATPSI
jgi:hypothetical protein